MTTTKNKNGKKTHRHLIFADTYADMLSKKEYKEMLKSVPKAVFDGIVYVESSEATKWIAKNSKKMKSTKTPVLSFEERMLDELVKIRESIQEIAVALKSFPLFVRCPNPGSEPPAPGINPPNVTPFPPPWTSPLTTPGVDPWPPSPIVTCHASRPV